MTIGSAQALQSYGKVMGMNAWRIYVYAA